MMVPDARPTQWRTGVTPMRVEENETPSVKRMVFFRFATFGSATGAIMDPADVRLLIADLQRAVAEADTGLLLTGVAVPTNGGR